MNASLPDPGRTPDRQREIPLGQKDFQRIVRIVHEIAGISLPDSKMPLVQARLARRLRALGLGTYRAYCALVEGHDEAAREEQDELVSAITTNVTHFFREPHHFEMLKAKVLPPLIRHAESGGRVRIWSAGCSTGQEPYSLALTVLAMAPDIARRNLRILATDLDRAVLETAVRGIYPESAVEAIPPALRGSHFQPARNGGDTAYAVGPAPRGLISFRRLNLTRDWPMKGAFDVILCRNVVIYFDSETEATVWRRLAERLPVGGWLFVGHSERVNTLRLPILVSDGVTTYRKVQTPLA